MTSIQIPNAEQSLKYLPQQPTKSEKNQVFLILKKKKNQVLLILFTGEENKVLIFLTSIYYWQVIGL